MSLKRWWRFKGRYIVALGAVISVAAAALALAEYRINETLNVNPDAQTGDTVGWITSAWDAREYQTVNVQPHGNEPPLRLFVSLSPSATMTHVVSVSEAAANIDSGETVIGVKAWLGGTSTADVGSEVIAQPRDVDGGFLGPPTQIGPPTSADRDGQAKVIPCGAGVQTPPGTRSVLLTVRSTANASANGLALADDVVLNYKNVIGTGMESEPAQGLGCQKPVIPPTPTPTSSSTPEPTVTASTTADPTPDATPTSGPEPTATPTLGPLRVRVGRLCSRRLELNVSRPAALSVRIKRIRPPRTQRAFRLRVQAPGVTVRHFRGILPGQYRVVVTVNSTRIVSAIRRVHRHG